jgi:hypothetical protein
VSIDVILGNPFLVPKPRHPHFLWIKARFMQSVVPVLKSQT